MIDTVLASYITATLFLNFTMFSIWKTSDWLNVVLKMSFFTLSLAGISLFLKYELLEVFF